MNPFVYLLVCFFSCEIGLMFSDISLKGNDHQEILRLAVLTQGFSAVSWPSLV